MKDLVVGDRVLTGSGTYEPVYSFGHRHDSIKSTYLQIETNQGRPLEISPNHMVFVSKGHAVPAGILKEGDGLLLSDGELTTIRSITTVDRRGVYAPFTLSGSIVVNGIVASSYVSLQPSSEYLLLGENLRTPLTHHWLLHAFEAPHRLAYRFGVTTERYTEEGYSVWVAGPLQFGTWLVQQNAVVMAMVIIPGVVVFGAFWCLEQHLLTCLVAVAVMLLISRSSLTPKMRRIRMDLG
ncbi:desert hedgehog-like protein [Fragilaria crotonensis]|nr:desert hedgehog-like protein [Fragilaria crotonensis]